MVLKFVANFEIIFFTIIFEGEYLSPYKTNVIETCIAYSYDIYAGNGVSEY